MAKVNSQSRINTVKTSVSTIHFRATLSPSYTRDLHVGVIFYPSKVYSCMLSIILSMYYVYVEIMLKCFSFSLLDIDI